MSNEKGLDKKFVRFVSYLVLTCGFFLMLYIMLYTIINFLKYIVLNTSLLLYLYNELFIREQQ